MEQERRMLEWKLRQQQRQSEEDSRWLAEEESHLVKKNFFWVAFIGISHWHCFYEAEKEVVCCCQFFRPIRHGFDGRSECVSKRQINTSPGQSVG
jgi:hypothetical protein